VCLGFPFRECFRNLTKDIHLHSNILNDLKYHAFLWIDKMNKMFGEGYGVGLYFPRYLPLVETRITRTKKKKN
jgi:hypothetical protein